MNAQSVTVDLKKTLNKERNNVRKAWTEQNIYNY